jgi:trimeric autotransporter adhesin
MSIKTNFKRVALVAVATLGAGVLSVAPANAVAYDLESGITAAGTNTGLTVSMASSGAGVPYALVCDAGTPTSSSTPRVIAVGGTSRINLIKELAADNVTGGQLRITGPAEFTGGTLGFVGSSATKFTVSALTSGGSDDESYNVDFKVTGTGTVRIDSYASSTDTTLTANASGKPYSFFVSGVAACGSGVSAANSYAQLVTADNKYITLADIGEGRADGTYTQTSTSAAGQMNNSQDETTVFANAATAYITVNTNNPQAYPFTTTSNNVVSCTNNATVAGTTGGYHIDTAFAGYETYAITQPTANAPLSTTCTFTIGGVVYATKSFKILGDIATVELTHYKSGNAEAATSTTNDGQLRFVAKDSAGNEVTAAGGSFSLTTASVTTRITAVSSKEDSVGANDAFNNTYGELYFNCLDYGTQNVAVKITNSAQSSITSNTVSAHCGGAVNTYTASFDKAQYQTGDIATLTITAKDASGGATWTGTTLGSAANGTFSVAVGGMTAVAAPVSTDTNTSRNTGVWTYTYKVDTTTGNYVAQVAVPVEKTTSANYNKPTLIQYKIISSDTGVSNADVLKAIVSLIASINKQIAALQKALLKR